MRLNDFWTMAVRRWYLVLVALVLSVGATLFAVNAVGSTYSAEGSVLVFPPVATVQRNPDQVVGNPYLVLDGVKQARDVVLRTLTSQAVGDELAAQNSGSSYTATPDYTNGAPVILISAEANTAEEASSALAAVMNQVPVILEKLQSDLNLPPETMITSRPLFADSSPTAVHKDQIRSGIVAGVVAMGLSLLFVGLLDGLWFGRASRRSAAPSSPAPNAESSNGRKPVARRAPEPARRLGPRTPVVSKRATSFGEDDSQGAVANRRLQNSSARTIPADADAARIR